MKRVIVLITVLVLCLGMVAPVYAAEDNFVPSIAYKSSPKIVPVIGPDGAEYLGVIRDANGNIIDYVGHGCLRITPISDLWDEEIYVPQVVEDLLRYIYESLNNGTMEIPYEKHDADLKCKRMVIRDLFDARWYCKEHPDMLAPEGVVLEIIFDLGIDPEAELFVMTFDEETEEWDPIVEAENNGDGTVTCTFEHLCAIEFSIIGGDKECTNIWLWIILLILAVVTFFIILFYKKKKKKDQAAA